MSEPSTEQAKGEPAHPLGLYMHVPFCASTCDFCAFYQTQPTAELVRRFLDGMEREAGLVQWTRPISTVFWGGGTPGLLAPRDLGRLAALVHSRARGQPAEWTVELAPASVTGERLHVLRDAGVTRVSLGVQSFQPDLLDALGRNHTREQIYRAYDRVRAAGFASVNLDLMFALPGQTAPDWAADVAAAVALAPDHLSTYCLTFEEDTKLWLKLSQGRVKLDPDLEADLYAATWEQLGAAGYPQYEISNFARPGHECRHNLNTWRMHEWIGLGPSAASQQVVTVGSEGMIAPLVAGPTTARREFSREDTLALFAEVYENEPDAPSHTLDISASVRSADGRVVFEVKEERSSTELQAGRGGFGFTPQIPLKDFEPGTYLIHVEARSRAGKDPKGIGRDIEIHVRP